MNITSTSIYALLASITLRLRFVRLSVYFAAKAGHLHKGARAKRDMRFISLVMWVMSNVTVSVEQRFYMLGYTGILPTRTLRRIFAGTNAHRAWLSGYMGVYKDEHGQRYGVCDRVWTHLRVFPQGKHEASALTTVGHILAPWGLPYQLTKQQYVADLVRADEDDGIPW